MSAEMSQNPFVHSTKYTDAVVHLGISGSVACYKAAELLRALLKMQIRVSATLTEGARKFVSPTLFRALGASPVYAEMFADEADVFAHLEPGQRARAMAIVPASANLIARLAHGLASDMLSAQALAFAGAMLIAPAMNPRMWANAATRANVETLLARGVALVGPGAGAAACGDTGEGRLADLPEIFLAILKLLSPQDMRGLKIMVTLGPTRERWDGVRFWSNPSSGAMGAAVATCAWLRGAEVWAICGPGVPNFLPASIKRTDVESAREMLAAATAAWPDMDMGCFCAAVADFAPERPENGAEVKIKKDGLESLRINFSPTPDILRELAGKKRDNQKILAFAAEITPDMATLRPLALRKLESKKADMIAANRVNRDGGAFGSITNRVLVLDKNGREEAWEDQSKADIAWGLCSWLLQI